MFDVRPRQLVLPIMLFFCYWTDATASELVHPLNYSAEAFRAEEFQGKTRYTVKDGTTLDQVGAPALAMHIYNLAIPSGMRAVSAELNEPRWVPMEFAGELALVPAAVSSEGIVVEPDLSKSTSVPNVELLGVSTLHGRSIAHTRVVPMRLAADGTLERLASAKLRVRLEPTGVDGDIVIRSSHWSEALRRDVAMLRATVENPDAIRVPDMAVSAKAPLPSERALDYVIITNEEFAAAFEPLAQSRREQGLHSEIVTTSWIDSNYRDGADLQESIRLFLREAYQTRGLSYALLGGDAEIVPPRYVRSYFYPVNQSTDIPADLYYSSLDGSWNANLNGIYGEVFSDGTPGDVVDLAPELAVGRAPVKTVAQVNTFVAKVAEYENPTNPQIHGRALFMSEVLFPSAWDGIQSIQLDGAFFSENLIFDAILGGVNFIQSWRLYENYTAYLGATEQSLQACLDSMQSGNYGLVNHVGHGFYYNMSVGGGNVFVGDANALTNAPNYFLLNALNCASGAFDFDCLLESFVQNPAGGAVASIGSSRSAFPYTADRYQQEFFQQVYVDNNLRMGDAINGSRLLYTGLTGSDASDRWTQFGFCLLGDPAMRVWRQEPKAITVSHSASVPQGATELTVDVDYQAGGSAIGVSVSLVGADGTVVTGITNLTGSITHQLGGLADEVGSLALFLNGQTISPYSALINVTAPTGATIRADVNAIDDDLPGPSDGDGDGVLDAGESVELSFSFENNGNGSNATNVSATLSERNVSGWLNITNDSISVGTLNGGQSVVPSDDCVMSVDPDTPDGTVLELQLEMTDGADTWIENFELVVLAPQLDVTRIRFDDSATGNGDGIAQAGESVELFVELSNFGAGTANSITGVLSSTSPDVNITDANNSWAALSLKQSGEGSGEFVLSESVVGVENWMQLTFTDSEGRVLIHDFELRVPGAAPTPQLDASLSPTSIAIRMDLNETEPHLAGYRVYRAADALGPFAEVTPYGVIDSGFFEDSGLAPLTRYHYYATALDSSAVEGPPSSVVDASTAPPELGSAFPMPIGDEVTGPLAVGDMRGDGSWVVGLASDFLYALDSNAMELLDGDQDSQTLGPLAGPSAPDNKWTPSGVSMADLDNDGKMELIGSNWATDEIWVVRDDGSPFPGWPQPMNNGSWAVPVVGDIDNNGDLEIIVNNVATWTYVWNHDGTDFYDGDNNQNTVGRFQNRPGESFNRSSPALYDVDGDGKLEIIFGSHQRGGNDNYVHALKNDATDAPGWGKNLGPDGFNVTSIGIADMDNDGLAEIVFPCDNDLLYVWQPDGSNKAGFPIPFTSQGGNHDNLTPSPAFADFDRNGDIEMVLVSVLSRTNSQLYIMDHDANVWPGFPVQVGGTTQNSPIVGDLNGDHSPDILIGIEGNSTTSTILYGIQADGTPVAGFPIKLNGSPKSPPVICDFDQDGDVDVVASGLDRLLHVWDMPFPYHPWATPWGTFHGNNRRTGVYLDDIVVATGGGSFELSVRDGAVVIRALWDGALPAGLRLRLERAHVVDGTPTEFERLTAELSFEDGQLFFKDETVKPGGRYSYRLRDERGQIALESREILVPVSRLVLEQNEPNPFNPATTIVFAVPTVQGGRLHTRVDVYDLAGRRVRELHAGPLAGGEHRMRWNGLDDSAQPVSSGTYFAVVRSGGEQRSIKMTLVK